MFSLWGLFLLTNIYAGQTAVLLWSNKELAVTPLQQFDDDDLKRLIDDLEHPETYIFKNPSSDLSPELKEVIDQFYSAYNPNGEINNENATDLLGDGELDVLKIRQTLDNNTDRSENFLSVVIIPNRRSRRDVQESTSISTTTTADVVEVFKKPEGPVVYRGQSKKDDLYSLMYSSKPLLLQVNDTKVYLGVTNADMITVDTRLNVIIPLEEGQKVVLRFSFSKVNGYWSLTSVKVTDTINNLNVNLTATTDIVAPARFSYHCSGETVFADPSSNVALFLYDFQVQIDSKNGKFSDASDCVTFTTVPIWSGLFVSALLGLGLIVAITAMLDIKTMDKFDNQKTKQLSITISE